MPKLKTKSGAKKRFRLTASGKVRINHAYKKHFMRQARIANLRRVGERDQAIDDRIRSRGVPGGRRVDSGGFNVGRRLESRGRMIEHAFVCV